jgi:hypothetical protein
MPLLCILDVQVCTDKGIFGGFFTYLFWHIWCASVLAHSFALLDCAVRADNETPNQTHD